MPPIEHSGIVKEITAQKIKIGLLQVSACHACHAKGACPISESQEKIIEIDNAGQDVHIDQTVQICIDQKTGLWALALGYIVPFLVVTVTLIIIYNVTKNELAAGLLSIVTLAIYYLILFVKNKTLNRKFQFYIKLK